MESTTPVKVAYASQTMKRAAMYPAGILMKRQGLFPCPVSNKATKVAVAQPNPLSTKTLSQLLS